jgi:hypothetical protein
MQEFKVLQHREAGLVQALLANHGIACYQHTEGPTDSGPSKVAVQTKPNSVIFSYSAGI